MWYLYNSAEGIRASVSINGKFRGISGGEEIEITDQELQEAQMVCQNNPMLKLGKRSFLEAQHSTVTHVGKSSVNSDPDVISFIDPLTSDLLAISKVPVFGFDGKLSDLTISYNSVTNTVTVMSDKHTLRLVTKNTDGIEEETGVSEVLDFVTDTEVLDTVSETVDKPEEGLPVKKGAKAIVESLKRNINKEAKKKE